MINIPDTLISSSDRPVKGGNREFFQAAVNKALRIRSNTSQMRLGFHNLEKRHGGAIRRLASGILYDVSVENIIANYAVARLQILIPLGFAPSLDINTTPLLRIPAYLIGAEGIGVPFAKIKHNKKAEHIFQMPEKVTVIVDELLGFLSSGALPEIMFSYLTEISDSHLLDLEQLWSETNKSLSWQYQKKRLEMFRREAEAIHEHHLEEKILAGDYKEIQKLLCGNPPKCHILIESLTVASP